MKEIILTILKIISSICMIICILILSNSKMKKDLKFISIMGYITALIATIF